MFRKTFVTITFAAAAVGQLFGMAFANDEFRVRVFNAKTMETQVYKPARGMSYTIGSNRLVGYFEDSDGKCALTLMLFEQTSPDGTPDMSAARVQVSIRPGENALIDSAEGEAVELRCNKDAETVTAALLGQDTRSQ